MALSAGALIDTGASDVCIDFRLAQRLNLRPIRQHVVGTMGGAVPATVHVGVLEIPILGLRKTMPLYAFKVARPSFGLLLGRSFLAEYIVTFDGPNAMCTFAVPAGGLLPPDDE